MEDWQREFLKASLKHRALQFGNFTLKSGRSSPYFFNSGLFNTGEAFNLLCVAFSNVIYHSLKNGQLPPFDILLGPAYKGIPLVTGVAATLARDFALDLPFVYNRKEEKDHGDGGIFVGAVEKLVEGCRVCIVDDVITGGTAIDESMRLLETVNASVVGVVVALNREEKGGRMEENGGLNAVELVKAKYMVDVVSVVTLSDLISFLSEQESADYVDAHNRTQKSLPCPSIEDIRTMLVQHRKSNGLM